MTLRTDITHEIDLVAADPPPIILENIKWVGKDGKEFWCWASCAVMVMRYLKEDWRQETDDHKLLCERVASQAVRGGERLVRRSRSCCGADQCNSTLSQTEISDLWRKLLGHPPKLSEPNSFPDSKAMIKAIIDEIQINRSPVEVALGGRIGHAIILYGCQKGDENIFYKYDPDLDPRSTDTPQAMISEDKLIEECEFLWFDLK